MSKIKELEQQVHDLNYLLLEGRDHINALGAERDKYKTILKAMLEQISKNMDAEEFVKHHFPGIENETWYPAIVAISEGYLKYKTENDKK